jgi:hypothetical protein
MGATMPSQLLTKSRYITGLQCLKLLWIEVNQPERIPAPDINTQYTFDQGHLAGQLAQTLFPGGINIPTDNFMDNVRQTRQLLSMRSPLFEAGLISNNIYSRIDILNPVNEDEWDIIEVKSSTSIKDVHLDDVAFQKFCCGQLGLNIRKCFLMYINNQYVKHGQINPGELFTTQDISEDVEDAKIGMYDRVEDMLEMISAPLCPEVGIGKHCREPYVCSLRECWEGLPEHNVFTLYYGGKKAYDMHTNGILAISDIPDSYKLNGKQQIQHCCVVTSQPYVDSEAIRQFLSSLQYPLCFFDFETIGPAIPLFDGTRPYQDVPFQYSLHVVEREGAMPFHYSFLADGPDDPRPALLTELRKTLPDFGSVIVYNQGFEEGIMKELALAFPQYDGWIASICTRFIDLLTPFRQFHYYHPNQKGSASLKSVLPALTSKGYEGMAIADGMSASIIFQQVTYGDVSPETGVKVRADLEKYCSLDTEGMIFIVDELRALCR